MSKLRTAATILKEQGVAGMFREIHSFYFDRNHYDLEYIISRLLGSRSISIEDTKITVSVQDLGSYNELKFILKHELPIIEDILSEVKAEDIFLDVGANIGVHSIVVDKRAKTVYAIEPHPVNVSVLNLNSTINNSSINIFDCGFSDSEGYTDIIGPRKVMRVDGSASIEEESNECDNDVNPVSVRVEEGDDFISQNNLEVPQIIKIDVEGAEMQVLYGLDETIRHRDCRVIYCEVHDENIREVRDYLNSLGYSTETIGNHRIVKGLNKNNRHV